MSEPQKIGADRTGMLERYNEQMGIVVAPAETAEAPEAANESSESANKSPTTEAKPDAKHTEEAPKGPVAKEVVASDPGVKDTNEKQENTKTVSLSALHEEREKRKAKTLEVRQLQEELSAKDQKLAELSARLASVEDTIRKAKAGEPVDDTDDVAAKLAAENKSLKEAQAKAEQEKRQAMKEAADKETARLISVADETLLKEGFPGFKQFGRDVYNAIVAKIQSGEIEEKDVTTDMWAKVYKEEVYPKIKAVFAPQLTQEKADAKKQQKKAANLVATPGEGPTPKDEDNLDAPQTAESYMKMRKTIR